MVGYSFPGIGIFKKIVGKATYQSSLLNPCRSESFVHWIWPYFYRVFIRKNYLGVGFRALPLDSKTYSKPSPLMIVYTLHTNPNTQIPYACSLTCPMRVKSGVVAIPKEGAYIIIMLKKNKRKRGNRDRIWEWVDGSKEERGTKSHTLTMILKMMKLYVSSVI